MLTLFNSLPAGNAGKEPSVFALLRAHWKYLLVIAAGIAFVFGRTLTYDFVTYDDYELVYQNGEYLSHPANVVNAFTTHAFTTHRQASGYYRPLLLCSYIADYQIWKLNPLGYHLTNICIHMLATIALFLLLELLLHDALLSLLGAFLFAFHPVQAEAVGWIAGRNDLLLGLFVIVMVLAYCLHREKKNGVAKYISIIAFGAALFTKESAAFYFLLLPLLDGAWKKRGRKELLLYAKQLLPFVLLLACYILIRASVIGGIIGVEKLYGSSSFTERVMNIPAIVSEHLKFILVPAGYSVVHPFDQLVWLHQPWAAVAWCTLVLFAGLTWRSIARSHRAAPGIGWVGVGLLPLLGLFPLAVPILEHRLYLPMAGAALALTGWSLPLMTDALRRKVFLPLAVAIITALVIGSILRLPVWQNSETLWLDAIEKAPAASRSYFNLAGYYFEHQEYEKTIGLMKHYVELKPDDPLGYIKLRQTLLMIRRYDEASQLKRALIECYERIGDSAHADELRREPEPVRE